MKYLPLVISCALLCALSATPYTAAAQGDSQVTAGTFKGTLHTGTTGSYLLYVGAESGDFAAFCFPNASAAGKAILAKCGDGSTCEFKGKVDQGAECKVDRETQKVLSGSGKVLSVTSTRLISGKGPKAVASAPSVAPDVLVRNLYAAHNADRGPFFQTKSRALVDKYFTKEFADLIWKDRIDAGNEASYIDFDPLFNAQDTDIKAFKVGKPEPGEGNINLADVPVTFKNFGAERIILFRLLKGTDRSWKISDIFYPGEKLMPSLKDHLKQFVGK
jgi:hypothetical protein